MPPSAVLSTKMSIGIQLHEFLLLMNYYNHLELSVSCVVNVQVKPVFILV